VHPSSQHVPSNVVEVRAFTRSAKILQRPPLSSTASAACSPPSIFLSEAAYAGPAAVALGQAPGHSAGSRQEVRERAQKVRRF
jgi:hypothetical protein